MEFILADLEAYTAGFSDEIGHGGFSRVYRGVIPENDHNGLPAQTVAVKVSIRNDFGPYDNEIEHTPRDMHPNIVHLVGYCTLVNRRYIVFPFVEGGPLDQVYTGFTWREVLGVAKGIVNGIGYFHNLDLVIGDLKPPNILLDQDRRPLLCDFGTVAHIDSPLQPNTLTYLDPLAFSRVTAQKDQDIYALGVILLQLLMKREALTADGVHITNHAKDLYRQRGDIVNEQLRSDPLCRRRDARAISRLALSLVLLPTQLQPVLGIAPPADPTRLTRPGIETVRLQLQPLRARPRGILSRILHRLA